MRVLITAFDAFGGERINAVEEILKGLKEVPKGVEVIPLSVPTVFGRSVRVVTDAIDAACPDAVLCLGQAAGRGEITPERIAVNLMDARIPDNEGNQPQDEPIVPNGPAAYFSTLPLRRMEEALKGAGLPASLSNTAGTFVCNRLMYGVLHALADRPAIPAGFVHFPCLPEQAEGRGLPSMPLDDMVRGLETILAVLAEN